MSGKAPDAATIRAWWWARTGLDGSLRGRGAAEVLERSGWARSVGGVGPYLGLFARGGIGRDAADADVGGAAIHELPAARGCTYVVPAVDYGLALTVGREFAEAPVRQALKYGLTEAELDALCTAVVDALREPLDPNGIRDAVGDKARSLGPEAKKKGIGTTLPLALGRLQAAGAIRRIPTNGRLDNQRYRYARWPKNPMGSMSSEEAFTELGRRYFAWVGPATAAQFQWFSGLGVKAAKAAIAPLRLVPVGDDDPRLVLPEDLDTLRATAVPKTPSYALVGSLDSLVAHRRDLSALLEPQDSVAQVMNDASLITLGSLADLPSHAILDRGRLVGLWEYDPAEGTIAWSSFVGRDDDLRSAVARTEAYVRDELGDARSFSLDSPESRGPRIAALRAS